MREANKILVAKVDAQGDMLNKIYTALVGLDGTNGIRGEVKGLRSDVDNLKTWRATREGQVTGGWWTLTVVGGLAVVVSSAVWAVIVFVVPLWMKAI